MVKKTHSEPIFPTRQHGTRYPSYHFNQKKTCQTVYSEIIHCGNIYSEKTALIRINIQKKKTTTSDMFTCSAFLKTIQKCSNSLCGEERFRSGNTLGSAM